MPEQENIVAEKGNALNHNQRNRLYALLKVIFDTFCSTFVWLSTQPCLKKFWKVCVLSDYLICLFKMLVQTSIGLINFSEWL